MTERSLSAPGVAAEVARRIHYDINAYAIQTYYDAHRWHLGASLIGHECSRYLWFLFRWCGREEGMITKRDPDEHTNLGRKLRLFNRGHREEERFIEFLKGIGCQVWTHDENGNQFRMKAVNGHFGGSIDGVIKLPPQYGISEPLLAEFKTNGTGKGFEDLKEKLAPVAKPQHFIQMSCYGKEYNLPYSAYFNVNKNDDDLHVEITKLNFNIAEQMQNKAIRIITATDPPARLAENATYFKCTHCAMKKVCHEGAAPEVNCRSCVNASPSDDAEWFCRIHKAIIPRDVVPNACPQYKALING